MTPEQKIAKVFKQIKDESAINPDSSWMKFDFNYYVVGAGILSEDEERRILLKLEKEEIIKLYLSQYESNEPKQVAVISSMDGEKFLTSPFYWVKILEDFEEKYKIYSPHLQPTKVEVKKKQKMNKHKAGYENNKNPLTISGDYIAGDKVGRDKNIKPDSKGSKWLEKHWFPTLLFSILAIVIGYIITTGEFPKLFKNIQVISLPIGAKTLDRSVFQLVEETDYTGPILNMQKKWKELAEFKTKDEKAIVLNYGESNLGKTWVDLRSTNTNSSNVITCIFANGWRQKIEMIGSGDKKVIFSGTIRGDLTQGRVPILDSCSIKELTDY